MLNAVQSGKLALHNYCTLQLLQYATFVIANTYLLSTSKPLLSQVLLGEGARAGFAIEQCPILNTAN